MPPDGCQPEDTTTVSCCGFRLLPSSFVAPSFFCRSLRRRCSSSTWWRRSCWIRRSVSTRRASCSFTTSSSVGSDCNSITWSCMKRLARRRILRCSWTVLGDGGSAKLSVRPKVAIRLLKQETINWILDRCPDFSAYTQECGHVTWSQFTDKGW